MGTNRHWRPFSALLPGLMVAWKRLYEAKRLMGFEPTTFCMASRRSSQLSYSRVNGGF
jgi:hypothetical protein